MSLRRIIRARACSSTLIEVITALIIISMVFSMAIVIYLNVQKSGFFSRKLSSNMMIDEVFNTSVYKKEFSNKQVNYDDIVVTQDVQQLSIANELLIIKLEARDENGKLLAEQKHLVYVVAKL